MEKEKFIAEILPSLSVFILPNLIQKKIMTLFSNEPLENLAYNSYALISFLSVLDILAFKDYFHILDTQKPGLTLQLTLECYNDKHNEPYNILLKRLSFFNEFGQLNLLAPPLRLRLLQVLLKDVPYNIALEDAKEAINYRQIKPFDIHHYFTPKDDLSALLISLIEKEQIENQINEMNPNNKSKKI